MQLRLAWNSVCSPNGLKLSVLLSQLPGWDYRYEPPFQAWPAGFNSMQLMILLFAESPLLWINLACTLDQPGAVLWGVWQVPAGVWTMGWRSSIRAYSAVKKDSQC
jgi:hypothetical protein